MKSLRQSLGLTVEGEIPNVVRGKAALGYSRDRVINSMPIAAAMDVEVQDPIITRSKAGVTITHREFVQNVNSTINFTTSLEQEVNPGNATLFPWLSSQAASYERYHFNFLRLKYIGRSPTTMGGSVLLIPIYDPKVQPPATEALATTFRGVVEFPPYSPMKVLDFDLSMSGGTKYVKKYLQAGDIRTSDLGKFVLSTVGGANTTDGWGKLWVEYSVTLLSPITVPTTPQCSAVSVFYAPANQAGIASGVNTAINLVSWHNGLDIPNPSGTSSIILPAGSYFIMYEVMFSTSANTTIDGSFGVVVQGGGFAGDTGVSNVSQDLVAAFSTQCYGVTVLTPATQTTYELLASVVTGAGTWTIHGLAGTIKYTRLVIQLA